MPDQLDIVIDSSDANQSIDSLERSLNEAVVKTDRLSEKLKKLKTDAPQKIYVDVEYREKGKPIQEKTDPKAWSQFAQKSRQQAQQPPSFESRAISESLKAINRELSQQTIALRAIQNIITAENAIKRSGYKSGGTEDKVRSGMAAGKESDITVSTDRWLNQIASYNMQMVPIQRDMLGELHKIKILLRGMKGGPGGAAAVAPPIVGGGRGGGGGWYATQKPPGPPIPPTLMNQDGSLNTSKMNPNQQKILRETGIGVFNRIGGQHEGWKDIPWVASVARTDKSPLGNYAGQHFDVNTQEGRSASIQAFRKDLWKKIQSEDKAVMKELNRLVDIRRKYGKLALMDWCAPKDCHADVIARAVDYMDKQRKKTEEQIRKKVTDAAKNTEQDIEKRNIWYGTGENNEQLGNIKKQYIDPSQTKIAAVDKSIPYNVNPHIDPNSRRKQTFYKQMIYGLEQDMGTYFYDKNVANSGFMLRQADKNLWLAYDITTGVGATPGEPKTKKELIQNLRDYAAKYPGEIESLLEQKRQKFAGRNVLPIMPFENIKKQHTALNQIEEASQLPTSFQPHPDQIKATKRHNVWKLMEKAGMLEPDFLRLSYKEQFPDYREPYSKPSGYLSPRQRREQRQLEKERLQYESSYRYPDYLSRERPEWPGRYKSRLDYEQKYTRAPIPVNPVLDPSKMDIPAYSTKDMAQFRSLAKDYAKDIVKGMSKKDISDRLFGYFEDQSFEEMRRLMDPSGTKGMGADAKKKLQKAASGEAYKRISQMSDIEKQSFMTSLFEEKGFEKIKKSFQEQQRTATPRQPIIPTTDRRTDYFLNSDLEQSNKYFDISDRINPTQEIDDAWANKHINAAKWSEIIERRKKRGQATDWKIMPDALADKIYRENMIIKDHTTSGMSSEETPSEYWDSEKDYFMKQQAKYGAERLLKKQLDSMTAEGLGGAEPSQMRYRPWTKKWHGRQEAQLKALEDFMAKNGPLTDVGNQEWARIQAEELQKQEDADIAAHRVAQKNEIRRQQIAQQRAEDLARKFPAQTAQQYEARRRLAYENRDQQITSQRTPFEGPDQKYMAPRQRREAAGRNKQFESWFMPAGTEPSGHIQTHGDLNKRFAAAERRKQTELDNIQLREIERRPDGINKIQEAARKRQGQINTVIENEQLRQIERRPEGIDRVGEMMRKRQEFFNLIDTVDKVEIGRQEKKARVFNQAIDSMRDGSKTLPPPITRRFETESSQSTATGKKPSYEWKRPGQIVRAEDILSSIQLDERDRMTSEHGKLFARQFDSKALIDANKDAVRSSENLLAAEQHLAKSKKELNDYRKDGLALIEREIKKQNEAGKMMLPHEQERFRKQQVQNLEDSMRKEIQKNKELEDSRNRLTSAYQNDAEKMKRAIAERHRSLKTLEKIEAEYRKKADTGKLTKAEEDLYRDTIKPRMAQERQDLNYYKNQLSEHRRYQDMIQKTGMSLRDLKTIEENYGKTLKKTTQGYREAGEVLRKQGILGYGSEKRVHNLPRLQTGGVIGTGRGGGGGNWDSNRITQVPQNPLMGRMAQFGMMASGMAATVFLTQMIGAQIANLINIIKAFEDSIESITESVKMTDNEINALPKVIRQYSNQMGIGTAMFAAATEVALKAGLSGKKEDIASLYGLQRSQNINNYGQATLLTRLAGSSSFFADIRKEYMQQWYRYSGRTSEGAFQIDPQTGKKQLGTFGYEWERLLGAGKESVLEIFFKENTKYGERLKRTMADITEWINTNQETFGRWADNVGTGINVVRSGFSLLGKELLMVLGLWASWQVGALAASGIKILSTNIVKVTNILKTFKDAIVATAAASMGLDMGMAGVAKTGMSLGAIFTGMISALKSFLVPALAFFAAFKTGLYLWDKWQESKRKSSIMESNRAFDPAGMTFAEASKQLPSINKEIEIRKKAISEAENKIRNINKTRDQGTDLWGTGLLQTSMAESRAEKKLTSEIEQNKEYLEILKAQKQEIMEIEEIEAFGRSFKGIYEMKEILSVLQQTNQELGFMPAELAIYERGAIEEQYKKWQELLGTGTARALTSIAMLDLSMKEDPDKKALYDISQAMDEIGVIGYNQYDRQAFKIKTIKNERENQLRNLSQLIETDPNIIKEITSIEQEIDQLSKLIVNFQKLSAIENVINFKKALYDLQITIQDMDKSPLEKIFSEIDRRDIEGSNKEILKMNEALKAYSQLQKDFLKSAGMNPENADKLRDLNAMYERTGREKDSAYYFNQVQIEYDRQKERIDLLKNIPTSFSGTSKWYDSLYLEEKLNETSLKLQQSKTIFNKRGDDKKITEMFEAASKKYGMNISTWDQYIQAQIDMTIASAEARNKIKEINLAWEDQIGLIEKFNLINPKYISDLEEIGKLKIKEEYPYLNEDDIEKKYKSQDLLKQLTDIQRDIEDVRIFDGWASAIALQEEIAKQEIKRIANEITKIKKFQEVNTEDIEQRLLSALNLQTNEFDLAQKFSEITQAVAASSGELTESAINNEYVLIKNSYEARKAFANEFKDEEIRRAILISAENIKQEEMYQAKLSMRKHIDDDIQVGFEEGFRAIRDQSKTTGEMIGISISTGFDHASNAMGDFITGTKSASEAFRNMASSIISDLTRMMIKQQMMNLLIGESYSSKKTNKVGGIIGTISGLFGSSSGFSGFTRQITPAGVPLGFAKGGVFSNISDQSNTIINKTTPFEYSGLIKFASGAGVMGEAGPEAVMPLIRMPSGNLGVEAKSSLPKIKINIINKGNSDVASATQEDLPQWNGEEWVIGVVLEHVANNKKNFRTSMKGMLNA